ncbi:hypothetical protein ACE14D_00740 [Streptomyces sp. Act-28]
MFEIRILCAPGDTDRIRATLAKTFTTGPARQYPTRDPDRVRLYVTTTHRDTDQ